MPADFLKVGPVVVEVTECKQIVDAVVGERVRAYDQSLRSTEQNRKRAWAITTRPMLYAEIVALIAACDFGNFVLLGGTALGFSGAGTIECVLELGEQPYLLDPNLVANPYGWQGTLSFIAHEA